MPTKWLLVVCNVVRQQKGSPKTRFHMHSSGGARESFGCHLGAEHVTWVVAPPKCDRTHTQPGQTQHKFGRTKPEFSWAFPTRVEQYSSFGRPPQAWTPQIGLSTVNPDCVLPMLLEPQHPPARHSILNTPTFIRAAPRAPRCAQHAAIEFLPPTMRSAMFFPPKYQAYIRFNFMAKDSLQSGEMVCTP